jgi:hypothetical protein
MMCRRPQRRDCVYSGFDAAWHVIDASAAGSAMAKSVEGASGWRAGPIVAGMDFGMRRPLVMLWARLWWPAPAESAGQAGLAGLAGRSVSPVDARLDVIGEYVASDRTLEAHLEAIEALAAERGWERPAWVGVDPAGLGRNTQTGISDVTVLRRRGYVVRAPRRLLAEGLERVRRRLDRGTLRVDRGCRQLIDAVTRYHFDPDRPACDVPVKDGPDHACDALRYLVVAGEAGRAPVRVRRYA